MTTLIQTKNQQTETTTSFGGENMVGFRVISTFAARSVAPAAVPPRTMREANEWLLKNAAKVDAHAKASTKRLIGRDSV